MLHKLRSGLVHNGHMASFGDLAALLSEEKLAYPVAMPRPNAPVNWVSSTELPEPAQFLEPETLVLTNGMFAGPEYDWGPFVQQVGAAGVTGLGIGLAITFFEVPPGLVSACEKFGMNLLCLEGHVPFVTVSRVAVRYLERQNAEPKPVPTGLLMQQQLSRSAVSGSRLGILRTMASILRATAAIHDARGQAKLGPVGTDADTYSDGKISHAVAELGSQGSRGSMSIVEADKRLIILPLGLSGKPREYLGVMAHRPFDEWERSSLNLAMSLLSLEAESRRAQARNVNRAHRAVLRLLSEGQTEAARTAAAEFGLWFPGATVQALLARGDLRLDQVPEPALRAKWGNDVLILTAEPLAAELLSGLPVGTQVGIGGAQELEQVGTSLAQARQASRMTSEQTPLVTWQEARVSSIAGCFNRELAEQFVSHQLGKILGDRVLLETVEAYLSSNGSVTAASAKLGVHRNTLNYRLRQLHNLLGDLDDPTVRANLWVALDMRRESIGGFGR